MRTPDMDCKFEFFGLGSGQLRAVQCKTGSGNGGDRDFERSGVAVKPDRTVRPGNALRGAGLANRHDFYPARQMSRFTSVLAR